MLLPITGFCYKYKIIYIFLICFYFLFFFYCAQRKQTQNKNRFIFALFRLFKLSILHALDENWGQKWQLNTHTHTRNIYEINDSAKASKKEQKHEESKSNKKKRARDRIKRALAIGEIVHLSCYISILFWYYSSSFITSISFRYVFFQLLSLSHLSIRVILLPFYISAVSDCMCVCVCVFVRKMALLSVA